MKTMIQAAPVVRNQYGEWRHPDMPEFDEGQAQEWRDWIEQQGLEVSRGMLEDAPDDHPAYVAYFEEASADFSAWTDTPPDGDGWFTLAVFDTEDGPVWCWARRKPV